MFILLCTCIFTLAAADLSIAVVSGTLKMRLGTAGYASSTLTTTTDQHGFHPQPQHPRKLTSKLGLRKGGKGSPQQLQRYRYYFFNQPSTWWPTKRAFPLCFAAAALSITTLYRSSRQTSKRAYNTGYAAACQDVLSMIQQGVSAGGDHAGENPMSVGRIMDWVEARCDAIKAREEEEDEEEQKEKEKDPQPPQSGPKPPSRTKRQVSTHPL
jgi:hypothetical protein